MSQHPTHQRQPITFIEVILLILGILHVIAAAMITTILLRLPPPSFGFIYVLATLSVFTIIAGVNLCVAIPYLRSSHLSRRRRTLASLSLTLSCVAIIGFFAMLFS